MSTAIQSEDTLRRWRREFHNYSQVASCAALCAPQLKITLRLAEYLTVNQAMACSLAQF